MLRISRRKFRALCAQGIDIQYNKKLKGVETNAEDGNPRLVFEDGSSVTGDLLIGADGANSVVRSSVIPGPDGFSQRVPYGGINMHVCYNNAKTAQLLRESLSPIMGIGVHPDGYWLWLSLQDIPDPASPQDWVFQLQWTWKLDTGNEKLNSLDLGKLKAVATHFAEPFRTAWIEIPEETKITSNKISVWPPKLVADEQSVGKVALIGDAGHAMSFYRGQGMNHGIADAAKLCELLKVREKSGLSLNEVIRQYEQEMITRAGEEVAISKMNTEMMHDWDRLIQSPFMQRGGDKNK